MNKEQIEEAAIDYVNSLKHYSSMDLTSFTDIRCGFIAGAEFRQAEIDELAEFIKSLAFSDSRKLDKARKILKKYEQ